MVAARCLYGKGVDEFCEFGIEGLGFRFRFGLTSVAQLVFRIASSGKAFADWQGTVWNSSPEQSLSCPAPTSYASRVPKLLRRGRNNV
jgi:hypothetical protein